MLICGGVIYWLASELKWTMDALDDSESELRFVQAQHDRLRAAIAPPTKRPPKKITARKPKRTIA